LTSGVAPIPAPPSLPRDPPHGLLVNLSMLI
jgi:hypothetical protein